MTAYAYSGWVGGDDWRVVIGYDCYSPSGSTQGSVVVSVGVESVYAYARTVPISINVGRQTANDSISISTNSTNWTGKHTFYFNRGHENTGISISAYANIPSSPYSSYKNGTTAYASCSLEPVDHHTFTYNGNGGTVEGNSSWSNTKWYGEHYYIPTLNVVQDGYSFLGWGDTSSSSASRWAGTEVTDDVNKTFYAVWKRNYIPPTVTATVQRCKKDGTLDDEGTYAYATVNYAVDTTLNASNVVSNVYANINGGTAIDMSPTTKNAKGTITKVIGGSLATDNSYSIRFTVTDNGGESSTYVTVSPSFYTIDFLKGGKGLAFGKAATSEGMTVAMPFFMDNETFLYMNMVIPNIDYGFDVNNPTTNFMKIGTWKPRSTKPEGDRFTLFLSTGNGFNGGKNQGGIIIFNAHHCRSTQWNGSYFGITGYALTVSADEKYKLIGAENSDGSFVDFYINCNIQYPSFVYLIIGSGKWTSDFEVTKTKPTASRYSCTETWRPSINTNGSVVSGNDDRGAAV